MAVITKPLKLLAGLTQDRPLAGFLQAMIDRIEKARIEAVTDLNQTIAGPSIAEVQAISDKVDELLAELRTAKLMDE